jgi:hypothetical protein
VARGETSPLNRIITQRHTHTPLFYFLETNDGNYFKSRLIDSTDLIMKNPVSSDNYATHKITVFFRETESNIFTNHNHYTYRFIAEESHIQQHHLSCERFPSSRKLGSVPIYDFIHPINSIRRQGFHILLRDSSESNQPSEKKKKGRANNKREEKTIF